MQAVPEITADLSTIDDMVIPCEHQQHGTLTDVHADGDEHYVKVKWECGHGNPNRIYVVCRRWLESGVLVRCIHCDQTRRVLDGLTDLGPVRSYL